MLVLINSRSRGFEEVAQLFGSELLRKFNDSNNYRHRLGLCTERRRSGHQRLLRWVVGEDAGVTEGTSGAVAAKFRLCEGGILPSHERDDAIKQYSIINASIGADGPKATAEARKAPCLHRFDSPLKRQS